MFILRIMIILQWSSRKSYDVKCPYWYAFKMLKLGEKTRQRRLHSIYLAIKLIWFLKRFTRHEASLFPFRISTWARRILLLQINWILNRIINWASYLQIFQRPKKSKYARSMQASQSNGKNANNLRSVEFELEWLWKWLSYHWLEAFQKSVGCS